MKTNMFIFLPVKMFMWGGKKQCSLIQAQAEITLQRSGLLTCVLIIMQLNSSSYNMKQQDIYFYLILILGLGRNSPGTLPVLKSY